jgi:hypothetical protein
MCRWRRACVLLAAFAVSLAAASPALAARIDVVVFLNGDHLTCEVIQMRQGKLQVKTDDAGTISIEWDKIAALTTADQYELTMQDGSQRLGRFAPGPTPGTLQVAGSAGTSTAPMADVASFMRIQTKFLQRIDGSLDLGASYSQSSGVADLWFNSKATYRRPKDAFAAAFSTKVTRQPDVDSTSRYSLVTSYSRDQRKDWIVSTLGLLEGNRDLGFSFRGTLAESVGRYLVRSRHAELLATGGLAAGRESPIDRPRVTNIDALATTNLSIFSHDYPTTRLDVALLVFTSLDDPGRVRLNLDSTFKRELFKNFFVAFTLYDAFDNRPKSAAAKQNDVGGSLSFGYTF